MCWCSAVFFANGKFKLCAVHARLDRMLQL